MPECCSPTEIAQALAEVPEWRLEGAEIVRELRFKSYLDGAAFVARVAALAEAANHHPDIHLGWRKVTLRLCTHSRGGLTPLDFDLARRIEDLAS